jgi:hypothetical protein
MTTGNGLETNRDRLVVTAVRGEVTHPITGRTGWDVLRDGHVQALPGLGGINYSHFVGDVCMGIMGDHVEPGVSLANFETKWTSSQAQNALNIFAQVGNTAIVSTGDAKGLLGTVIGKHGGVEQVIVHFPRDVLDLLEIGDHVRIIAHGLGLQVPSLPDVHLRNLDPRLFERLPLALAGDRLRVGVSRVLPAQVMGSGIGADNTFRGDYDIQLTDPDLVREHRLDGLRFGDLVALTDTFDAYGRSWRPGAVSVGVVVHGDSRIAGHGPGVTTILAAQDGRIEPFETDRANLADILGLRRDSPGDHHEGHLLNRHKVKMADSAPVRM